MTTLSAAVCTALDHLNLPGEISFSRWAVTYNCTPEDVAAEFEKQRREQLTKCVNSNSVGGEMSGQKFEPRTDRIELVCGYIKDDQTIASYYGISRQRVEGIRANMRQVTRWMMRCDVAETPSTTGGFNSHLVAADEAEMGSRNLNAAIQRLFLQWEEKHGFQRGAAAILLPNGYVPERGAA